MVTAALAAALVLLGLTVTLPSAMATTYGGASAAAWPAAWASYTYANGTLISDLNDDQSPNQLDLASGTCAGCAGTAASVALTSDGTNAFFRMRMAVDNNDTGKGGLFGGAFIVQIADVNGAVKAIVGVDGTSTTADYVYAANNVGTAITKVYEYPFTGGSPSSAGMRWISTADGTGQYFLDFQVPLSVLQTVSGGAVTPSTPVKLYYGSSAASNLATINKDFMLGAVTTVDFSNLAVIKFVPPTYGVTFNSNGGSAVTSQTVTEGNPATAPTGPTRSGYTFDGWYTAASGGTLWSFSTAIGSATTLYAHWTWITNLFTFDSNGGSAVPPQSVDPGTAATLPAPPSRTGYTFDGWHTAASGGTAYDFSTPVNAVTTVHAHWTVNSYTVSFDANGGSTVGAQSVVYGTTATQPSPPSRSGYTFAGWYTAASGGTAWGFATPIATATTLYAQWDPITHSFTFDSNGGSAVSPQNVAQGSTATLPTAPTRTGYSFAGWYSAASGGTLYDFSTQITGANTVHAHWSLNSYTASFDANGGTAVADQSVAFGDPATEPTPPTQTGYTFADWYDGPTLYDFTDPITGATALKAHWTKNSYTVSFDSNGGSAVSDQSVVYGTSAAEPPSPTRNAYTFAGWYDGQTNYDFTHPVTGATALQAHWTKNSYTVSFDSNGGSTVADQAVDYGDPATLPIEPTRTGHTFTGWYANNTLYDFSDPITGTTQLTAHWSLNSYTVSFDA
ncbi:InlB B-repeat-containing protein, partial [Nocardioides sp.]|uniref:InlB B-repeat-containing protein n=1 Tax=Nocardioides sp. TaxID=35761 RepID=UPI0031FF3DD8|nr:inlA [Nocardioides sp.]